MLRRERNFQVRRGEFEEEWLPLPVPAALLVVASAAMALIAFFSFGAFPVYMAAEGERICARKAEQDDPAVTVDSCVWFTDLVTAERAQDLPGLVEGVAWLGVALALFYLVLLLLHVRSEDHRRHTWRAALWYEYVSWRDGRAERTWWGLADLGWVRWLVRLLWGVRRGDPEGRLRHARRWAWANEAVGLLGMIGTVLFGAVCAGLLLWEAGAVETERPVEWHETAAAAAHDLAWNLVRSIPVLELTDTLHWRRPSLLVGDRTWSVVMLAVKVGVFVPMVAYFVQLIRQRRDSTEPTSPLEGQPVVGAVIDALLATRASGLNPIGGWTAIYNAAAGRLNSAGTDPPAGSTEWSPAAVARELPSACAATPSAAGSA